MFANPKQYLHVCMCSYDTCKYKTWRNCRFCSPSIVLILVIAIIYNMLYICISRIKIHIYRCICMYNIFIHIICTYIYHIGIIPRSTSRRQKFLSGILLPITEVCSSIFPLYRNHVITIMAILLVQRICASRKKLINPLSRRWKRIKFLQTPEQSVRDLLSIVSILNDLYLLNYNDHF